MDFFSWWLRCSLFVPDVYFNIKMSSMTALEPKLGALGCRKRPVSHCHDGQQWIAKNCWPKIETCLAYSLCIWDVWLTWTFSSGHDTVFLIVFRFPVWTHELHWTSVFAGNTWLKKK
jgi:hypothetical protein